MAFTSANGRTQTVLADINITPLWMSCWCC